MTYSTIYALDGYTITDGAPTQLHCDACRNTAREIAAGRKCSVIVEDHGTQPAWELGEE